MKKIAILTGLFLCAQLLVNGKEILTHNSAKSLTITTDGNLTTLAATVLQSQEDKFTVRLHVENYTTGELSIKLKSSTTVLHKETVTHSKYARKYDMYNLAVGDYEIEVKNEKEKFTKKLSIKIENGKRVLIIS